jgi:hypothetical protein
MPTEPSPAPTAPDAGQNSASAASGSGSPAAGERTFTQAELEAAIKERLERQKRASDADQERIRKEAEARALADQGEYKKLAETAQAELATVRPAADRAATLEALIAQHIESILPTLPAALRELLPADLPVESRYAWVIKAQAQAATFAAALPSGGVGSGPPPAGALTPAQLRDGTAARLAAQHGYRL